MIEQLKVTDPTDEAKTAALGVEGLKILVESMPSVPTLNYIGFLAWDTYYWTNWPGIENAYSALCPLGTVQIHAPLPSPTGK
ncbi:MAG: hypothetical protein ABDI20_08435 [Candidatus Bipolaricaulaceae bacterium]